MEEGFLLFPEAGVTLQPQPPADQPAPAVAAPAGRCRRRLTDLFGIDLRTLALLRVVVGSLVLLDLIFRTSDLNAFYTDWGLLPRGPLLEKFSFPAMVSVHLLSGQAWAIGVLFLIAGVFAVMMILGYRTRLATVLSWFMLLSIQNRNTMVNDGGDDILRLLMFYLMFLPTGARFSIDAVLSKPSPAAGGPPACPPNRYVSVASAALLVQVCFIYWFTAEHKNHPIWWHGQAVSYALQLDIFATRFGHYLLNFPRLLKVLTYATLGTEILGPTIAFLPVFTQRVRFVVIAAFIGMHTGLGLCMALGVFPFICMAAWLSFLPSCFWDSLGKRVSLPDAAEWKNWLRERFPARPLRLGPTWIGNTIALCAILFALLWNLRMVNADRFGRCMPAAVEQVGMTFRLDQNWKLFAPYPMVEDGWFVVPGKLVNGSEADVLTGGPVTWEKPAQVSATFPNARWRKYMINMWIRTNHEHLVYFASYLCRRWDATHTGDLKMDTFRVFYMEEDSQPDASVVKPVPRMLWQHWCIKMPSPPSTRPANTTTTPPQPAATQPASQPLPGGEMLPHKG